MSRSALKGLRVGSRHYLKIIQSKNNNYMTKRNNIFWWLIFIGYGIGLYTAAGLIEKIEFSIFVMVLLQLQQLAVSWENQDNFYNKLTTFDENEKTDNSSEDTKNN